MAGGGEEGEEEQTSACLSLVLTVVMVGVRPVCQSSQSCIDCVELSFHLIFKLSAASYWTRCKIILDSHGMLFFTTSQQQECGKLPRSVIYSLLIFPLSVCDAMYLFLFLFDC